MKIFGFDNYIKNKISIETTEIMSDKLSHCNYCPRHCYLRPIKLEKFTYNQSFVAKPICNCQCNCRHTAFYAMHFMINLVGDSVISVPQYLFGLFLKSCFL